MTTRVISPGAPVAPVAPIYPCLYCCISSGAIALATSASGGVILTNRGRHQVGEQFTPNDGASWEVAGWVRVTKPVAIEFTP
jgi:hypothetical protein